MIPVQLECANCLRMNTINVQHPENVLACEFCGADMILHTFPAILEKRREQNGAFLLSGEESSCFFHDTRPAVVPCDGCGRFLCALCDIQICEQHFCPACIEAGSQNNTLLQMHRKYIQHDRLAFALVAYPLLIPLTFITAPMALFIVLWFWKKPQGVLPRPRGRFIAAGVIAALEIAAWAVYLGMILV